MSSLFRSICYELVIVTIEDLRLCMKWTWGQFFVFISFVCSVLFNVQKMLQFDFRKHWKTPVIVLIWMILYYAFVCYELGALYVMLSVLVAIFTNLGTRREGELSAYSIFNKGFVNLPGQLRAEDFEREIGYGRQADARVDDEDEEKEEEIEFAAAAAGNNSKNKREMPQSSHLSLETMVGQYQERLRYRVALQT